MPKYIDAVTAAEVISEKFKIPMGELVDVFAEIPDVSDGWISVKDDMPEEHDSIFARFYKDGTQRPGMFEKRSNEVITTGTYSDGSKFVTSGKTNDGEWSFSSIYQMTVTHWMPLPKPPEVDGD